MNKTYDSSAFGENLTAALKKKGITQMQLAEMVGSYAGVMSDYCRGKKLPSLWMFVLICKMLDMEPGEMLEKK